jgi:N utilization substance protein B
MTRDIARELAVQLVFNITHSDSDPAELIDAFFSEEHYGSLQEENSLYSEVPDEKAAAYIRETALGVSGHLTEIDELIQKYSASWHISRISGTALAVLRVAVYEILYRSDVPVGAAINSAVEIDKHYDEPETVAFVNGVLGGFVRGEGKT